MKKSIYGVLGIAILLAVLFVIGVTQEASAQLQVNVNIVAPPPLQFAAPPDVVVIPSGVSYVYMVPNYYGVYFYGGHWYRFYNGYWFRASIYNGYWEYIDLPMVPQYIIEKRAQQMGISFIPAASVVAGELSGFGIYLATTTGLGAISSAIGITFPWAMYQGATTVLGVMLGPIGWALAGAGVVAGGIAFLGQLFKRNDQKLTTVVIAIIIAIGDNPYEWFGFEETAPFTEISQAYRAMIKTFHPDLLPKHLPDWVKHRFNELLLQTQENYDQIKKYQAEETS